MTTKKQMIHALTKFELEYLRDYPEGMDDTTIEFFASGGFTKYTHDELVLLCQDNVWLEFEVQA